MTSSASNRPIGRIEDLASLLSSASPELLVQLHHLLSRQSVGP